MLDNLECFGETEALADSIIKEIENMENEM